jgi:hypothetical protein
VTGGTKQHVLYLTFVLGSALKGQMLKSQHRTVLAKDELFGLCLDMTRRTKICKVILASYPGSKLKGME